MIIDILFLIVITVWVSFEIIIFFQKRRIKKLEMSIEEKKKQLRSGFININVYKEEEKEIAKKYSEELFKITKDYPREN